MWNLVSYVLYVSNRRRNGDIPPAAPFPQPVAGSDARARPEIADRDIEAGRCRRLDGRRVRRRARQSPYERGCSRGRRRKSSSELERLKSRVADLQNEIGAATPAAAALAARRAITRPITRRPVSCWGSSPPRSACWST